jgi:hypothetical protein
VFLLACFPELPFSPSLPSLPLSRSNSELGKREDGKMGKWENGKMGRWEMERQMGGRAKDVANDQWTAAIHEWKRGWNDGSANWLLLDSFSLVIVIPPDTMIDE